MFTMSIAKSRSGFPVLMHLCLLYFLRSSFMPCPVNARDFSKSRLRFLQLYKSPFQRQNRPGCMDMAGCHTCVFQGIFLARTSKKNMESRWSISSSVNDRGSNNSFSGVLPVKSSVEFFLQGWAAFQYISSVCLVSEIIFESVPDNAAPVIV